VAGTGNGTVHEAMLPALLEAQAAGVKVLRTSRTAFGGVIGKPGDMLAWTSLSPVKARVALMLDLLRSRAPSAPAP
jgi:L-asparaginase